MESDLFSNLNASFDGAIILHNLTLDLPDTGSFCLFGPSGCGKTTLLRTVCARLLHRGRPTAFVFQEDRLFPHLTALQNAALPTNDSATATALLCELGLSDSLQQYPAELSGGMRRRVAIARALCYLSAHPDGVLLLDEPFTALDAASKEVCIALIRRQLPALLLLVTQDRAEADALCDRVLTVAGPPLCRID